MNIHDLPLALQRPPIRNRPEQGLDMTLKTVQVTHAVPRKLRPDQLATGVPLGAVGRKDAVAQKVLPLVVEALALAKVGKLRGQQRLDIVRVRGEDDAQVQDARLGGPGAGLAEDVVAPVLEVLLGPCGFDA